MINDTPIEPKVTKCAEKWILKFTEMFDIAELKQSANQMIIIRKQCILSPLSHFDFFLIFRSIWTSAPGFLWRLEAGRTPVLRAQLSSISTQLAVTALQPSPYWSITKSSWRGQPSEPSGCKDPPNLWGCLIKCLQCSATNHFTTTSAHYPGTSSIFFVTGCR